MAVHNCHWNSRVTCGPLLTAVEVIFPAFQLGSGHSADRQHSMVRHHASKAASMLTPSTRPRPTAPMRTRSPSRCTPLRTNGCVPPPPRLASWTYTPWPPNPARFLTARRCRHLQRVGRAEGHGAEGQQGQGAPQTCPAPRRLTPADRHAALLCNSIATTAARPEAKQSCERFAKESQRPKKHMGHTLWSQDTRGLSRSAAVATIHMHCEGSSQLQATPKGSWRNCMLYMPSQPLRRPGML